MLVQSYAMMRLSPLTPDVKPPACHSGSDLDRDTHVLVTERVLLAVYLNCLLSP
jgi:hypothetical protein